MIRRLHKDDSAQVSFLALAASLVLVGLMAMIINTSDVVRHRIHNQEVADVTALAAATWSARGLNTISMLNTLNAKILSMTVIVNAANRTMPMIKGIHGAQILIATACTPFCSFYLAILNAQTVPLNAMEAAVKSLEGFTRNCSGAAWNVMKGLQKAAEAVRKTFGRIGYVEAPAIAVRNGASSGFAVEGSLLEISGSNLTNAGALPASTQDRTPADFCTAMKSGGPGFVMEGYTEGEGPAEHGRGIWSDFPGFLNPLFVNLGAPWIFDGFYSSEMARLGCDGSTPEKEGQKVDFNSLPECREHDVTATWSFYQDETDWIPDGTLTVNDFVAWTPQDVELQSGGGAIDNAAARVGVESVAPVVHTPTGRGVSELTGQRRVRRTPASCAGGGRSGYPIVNRIIEGDIFPVVLRSHPDFTHFEIGESGLHREATSERSEVTGTYFLRVEQVQQEVPVEGGGTRVEYKYLLEAWVLSDAGEKVLEGEELTEYYQEQGGVEDTGPVSSGTQCGEFPVPHLLVDNADDKLRYFAVVNHGLGEANQPPRPFWSNYFSVSPTRFTSFSQAQVYNDLSTDMFTQDWRVRLERATLLEAALQRAGDLGLGSIASTASSVITTVNNH